MIIPLQNFIYITMVNGGVLLSKRRRSVKPSILRSGVGLSGASEDRFLLLGMSSEGRILIVCHCERDSGNTIRIISARKATRSERKYYPGGAL